jgi:hypothetical protein
MALIGNIEPFQPGVTDLSSYLERMNFLFMCNVVEEDQKVPLFLTLIGAEAYSVLKDLVSPDLPSSKTYNQLKTALEAHFSPMKIVIAERFHFYRCSQNADESISEFNQRLKKLTQNVSLEHS